ncbi:uncharacterized protein LOC132547308 [Ylistrum balloti]|uniref:uncharacterized protein LOC132547308 n=1 Tax=Ylistrum balloti TaxID=509963 RepID=UPI0029057F32|nr:uncharacterized protein LOC132547308 [Ylistrum balloti]
MAGRLVIKLCIISYILHGSAVCANDASKHWTEFVTSLDQKVTRLENLLMAKDARISELEARLDTELEKKNTQMSHMKQYIDARIRELENNQGTANENSEWLQQREEKEIGVAPSEVVAFHTKMSASKTLSSGEIIVYDEETLDQGNGYNPREGIYTVPVSGTYVITWKLLSRIHTVIVTSLVVNGEVMGSSDTDSEDITDIHQSTAIVVLPLVEGDHVLIRVSGMYHGGVVSDSQHGKATFSGWKI